MRRKLLLAIFFLSGISALIYEVCWIRQTTLTLGVSLYAYSLVAGAAWWLMHNGAEEKLNHSPPLHGPPPSGHPCGPNTLLRQRCALWSGPMRSPVSPPWATK